MPCSRISSIRLFMFIVVHERLFLTAFDISAAFLYGDWSEEFKDKMFMRIPEGYELFLAKHPANLPPEFETFLATQTNGYLWWNALQDSSKTRSSN